MMQALGLLLLLRLAKRHISMLNSEEIKPVDAVIIDRLKALASQLVSQSVEKFC